MKKKIFLVQASAVYGESIKTAYLPYAAGCLAAYAFSRETVKNNYSFGRFIYTREDIAKAASSLDSPYLVGFSCYIWNQRYNVMLARELKRRYPGVITVFGGHNVLPGTEELERTPEADFIIHGEGEIPFARLLEELAGSRDFASVPGLAYRTADGCAVTPADCSADISDFPSPYLDGWFDSILDDDSIKPSAIWETNRGCPNKCAFCDWGELKSKVRLFPMERIEKELRWFSENKVEYVYCADANFGLFPRDSEIADMIIESEKTTGFPAVFKTNYTKNRDDVVFEISSRLIKNRIGKSPTLSFQSLSGEVLKNIGRSNMDLGHFSSLMRRYNEADIPVYSELILALPGETYDSFSKGIDTLLNCGQHTAIGIYPCELLPNSQLGSREFREKHQIETVDAVFSQYHVKPGAEAIPEASKIIVSTSSMNRDDWKRSFLFSVTVQALHNLALTRGIAIWFRYEKNISYRDFYGGLITSLLSPDAPVFSGSVMKEISAMTDGILRGEKPFCAPYGDKEILTWTYEEYMFLRLVGNKSKFYDELKTLVIDYGIPEKILNGLADYSAAILRDEKHAGLKLECDYDFYGYFRRIYDGKYAPLEEKRNLLISDDAGFSSFDEYARECVWYGRRDDRQLYTGKRSTVRQIFDF